MENDLEIWEMAKIFGNGYNICEMASIYGARFKYLRYGIGMLQMN